FLFRHKGVPPVRAASKARSVLVKSRCQFAGWQFVSCRISCLPKFCLSLVVTFVSRCYHKSHANSSSSDKLLEALVPILIGLKTKGEPYGRDADRRRDYES